MIPLSSKNQPCRRTDGHDHVLPKATSAAASSLSRSNKITSEPTTSLQTATCTCSRRPSTHSPRPSPQRGGRYLDQISIGVTRGPRFSATKVSATPIRSARGLDHKYGVAETSPLCEPHHWP